MFKEKVRNSMRIKDQVLFEETGLHIFDEELFDKDFSEEDCQKFVEDAFPNPHNNYMCPWCQKFTCRRCTFGAKYGMCDPSEDEAVEGEEEMSLYYKIVADNPNGWRFIDRPKIKEAWEEMRK